MQVFKTINIKNNNKIENKISNYIYNRKKYYIKCIVKKIDCLGQECKNLVDLYSYSIVPSYNYKYLVEFEEFNMSDFEIEEYKKEIDIIKRFNIRQDYITKKYIVFFDEKYYEPSDLGLFIYYNETYNITIVVENVSFDFSDNMKLNNMIRKICGIKENQYLDMIIKNEFFELCSRIANEV